MAAKDAATGPARASGRPTCGATDFVIPASYFPWTHGNWYFSQITRCPFCWQLVYRYKWLAFMSWVTFLVGTITQSTFHCDQIDYPEVIFPINFITTKFEYIFSLSTSRRFLPPFTNENCFVLRQRLVSLNPLAPLIWSDELAIYFRLTKFQDKIKCIRKQSQESINVLQKAFNDGFK